MRSKKLRRRLQDGKLADQEDLENEICGWSTQGGGENDADDWGLPTFVKFAKSMDQGRPKSETLIPMLGIPAASDSEVSLLIGVEASPQGESKPSGLAPDGTNELLHVQSCQKPKHSKTESNMAESNTQVCGATENTHGSTISFKQPHMGQHSPLYSGKIQLDQATQRQILATVIVSIAERNSKEQSFGQYPMKRNGKQKYEPTERKLSFEPSPASQPTQTKRIERPQLERTFQLPRIVDSMDISEDYEGKQSNQTAYRKQHWSHMTDSTIVENVPKLIHRYLPPARQSMPILPHPKAKAVLLCRNDRVWFPKMKIT